MSIKIKILSVLLMFAFASHAQTNQTQQKEVSYTFYALGNIGDNLDGTSSNLNALKAKLSLESSSSMLLYLGNNASPNGLTPDNGAKNLDLQIDVAKSFDGRTVFIPGYSDWQSGLEALDNQQSYVEDALNKKKVFLPRKGCPFKREKLNDDVDVILVDSQWALQDWDKFPGINIECDIRNKTEFYEELESEIKKSEGKTVLVAMYHPVTSNGTAQNGINVGINPQKISNNRYDEFAERLITIAKQAANVILIAGHDRSLQYINKKGIPTINSGSGASTDKVKSGLVDSFASSELGFSKIIQYKDGSVMLEFYGNSNNYEMPVFSKEIIAATPVWQDQDFNEKDTPQYVNKSIYTPEELARTKAYKFLWGEHYRDDYATEIKIKTALLDTLYGGLKPLRKGGGHQTNSLRLEDKNGKQYALRSAKKSALRFTQYFLFKTTYLDPKLEDNYFIKLLQDYWTTANPYGSLTIGDMADAIEVLHPNPNIYYIPKQNALGAYNDKFGDKIFFIEERLSDGLGNVESLGGSDKLISSVDLYEELREDREDIEIDEALYIRTRLFDNLIGDWDRHDDQWKWAEIENEDGTKLYKPIPRDRDQVYSDFDGFVLGAITAFLPPMRFMQRYDEDYDSFKWFNDAGDDVDLAVLTNHTREDWLREARFIKENITDEVIDKAFENIPKEMDQNKVERVKKALKGRLANIEPNAEEFFEYLSSYVLVVGTSKTDRFVITRLPEGKTKVEGYRVKKDNKEEIFWDVTYDKKLTNEIWVYGLDDDDIFQVEGERNKNVHVKIIGGNGNDTYTAENRKNVKVYDQKSKPNTFTTKVSKNLSDNYDTNTYYYKTHRRDASALYPVVGYNPDNGFALGGGYSFVKNSLLRDPFTDKHQLSAMYFFDTSGVAINYKGEFAGIFNNVNLGLAAGFSSPNFSDNFFGIGNETMDGEDAFGKDYNRVRIQTISFEPSLIMRGYQGSVFSVGFSYENIEVEETEGRFIETADINPNVFLGQDFFSVKASYEYENFEGFIAPKGIGFKLDAGYTANFDEDKGFAFVIPQVKFTTSIIKNGRLVIATEVEAHINFGNDFEFHQAATLGDLDGLRGFRQQRFSGNQAFYHSTDLRSPIGNVRYMSLPIAFGVYGGFDYGRVWADGEDSEKWHNAVGGGTYLSLGGEFYLDIAYFTSSDGGRFVFGLNIPF